MGARPSTLSESSSDTCPSESSSDTCPICHLPWVCWSCSSARGQPSPARVTLQGQTPSCNSKTDLKHRPPATSRCLPLSPLTLLSFHMHYLEACKVAAASWSRTLPSAPFSTLWCSVLCISPLSGNAGLQTLPVLSDLVFCPLK